MATPFTYFVNERRALLVISWNGSLAAQDAEILNQCLNDIKKSPAKFIIMNMQGFADYDPVLAAQIVNIQETARKKPALLALAGLEKSVREKLATKGLVREAEIVNTLQDALQLTLALGLNSGGS